MHSRDESSGEFLEVGSGEVVGKGAEIVHKCFEEVDCEGGCVQAS